MLLIEREIYRVEPASGYGLQATAGYRLLGFGRMQPQALKL
jgi:hypothetical protein